MALRWLSNASHGSFQSWKLVPSVWLDQVKEDSAGRDSFSQFEESGNREQFECGQKRRSDMPIELMYAIGGANRRALPRTFGCQDDAALVAGAKTGTLVHLSYWSNGTGERFFH